MVPGVGDNCLRIKTFALVYGVLIQSLFGDDRHCGGNQCQDAWRGEFLPAADSENALGRIQQDSDADKQKHRADDCGG